MFLNPIVAYTGLWLRPAEYERKAGLSFKYAELIFSTNTELNYSTEMHLNSFYFIKLMK